MAIRHSQKLSQALLYNSSLYLLYHSTMLAFLPPLPSRCISLHNFRRLPYSVRKPTPTTERRSLTTNMSIPRKSAAALIIGDEILSGKTLDRNTQELAKFLYAQGVTLSRTETIPDDVPTISSCVRSLSASHDLVFTSGGIGPTPDDMTYEAVAHAFSVPLELHEPTIKKMREIRPEMEINEARKRMALLPQGCSAYWTDGLWVPLACMHNVFVLPGIPKLFTRMLKSVPTESLGDAPPRARVDVLCDWAEGDLAAVLEDTGRAFSDVVIGSYPASRGKGYRTMVTVVGDDGASVEKAAEVVRLAVTGWLAES